MDLLDLLNDGQFHSGEALGERLGISRAAVSKQLQHWRDQGLMLDVVHGKGYRLRQPLEWLSESAILGALSAPARAQVSELGIHRRIGSTNDHLMHRLREQPQSGLICLAEQQTNGRGRRGREWLSPLGCNFYGSVSWTFSQGFAAIEGLSLALGVAVAEALECSGGGAVGVKWPNDIMAGERKLAGLLLEMQGEAGGPVHLVIGLGVNFYLAPELAAIIDRPVTDLQTLSGARVNRNAVTALLLDAMLTLLRNYADQGFGAWRDRWLARDVTRDQLVNIVGVADTRQGYARGVDAQGALLLETTTGVEAIHSGEVSLRPVVSA